MSKLSLLDKLKVLSDVTSSSGLFAVAILFFVVFFYLMIATNTKTKKISKISCIAIYGSIIIVTLVFYREQLFSLFDYMMNNFFVAIYFPNLAIYFAAVVATNIILWISIFNRKVTKWIRTINTLVFCMIHYLLVLIINIITTNKLNIFEQTSIYENQDAQALIELSSNIFIIWILFLIIYKIIRNYQKRQEEQVVEQPEKIIMKEPAPPIVKTETVVKRQLPDSIKMIDSPNIILGNIRNKEENYQMTDNFIKQENISQRTVPANDNSYLFDIPDPILTTEPQFLDVMLKNQQQEERKEPPLREEKKKSPAKKQSKELDILDGLLTLDDYKRVLSILKTYQAKQQDKNSNLTEEQPRKVESLSELYHRR